MSHQPGDCPGDPLMRIESLSHAHVHNVLLSRLTYRIIALFGACAYSKKKNA